MRNRPWNAIGCLVKAAMAANAGAIFAGRHQGSSVTAGPVYDIDGNEVEVML